MNRINFDLPMEDYLANSGESSSKLKKILFTPADYLAASKSGKFEDTKFTILGEAIHTAILEPDFLFDRFALQPADWGPRNKKPGSVLWKHFKNENVGKKVIPFEEAELIIRANQAARKNVQLDKLLNDGRPEVSAFCQLRGGSKDLVFKARTDLYIEHEKYIELNDIKTCSESISDDNLFKIILNNGYHFQAAHHSLVFERVTMKPVRQYRWIFISTRSDAVHVRIVVCPEKLLEWGRRDHEAASQILFNCLESNEWPGYTPVVENLIIPEWANKLYE